MNDDGSPVCAVHGISGQAKSKSPRKQREKKKKFVCMVYIAETVSMTTGGERKKVSGCPHIASDIIHNISRKSIKTKVTTRNFNWIIHNAKKS